MISYVNKLGTIPVGNSSPVRIMGILNTSPESFYKKSISIGKKRIADSVRRMEEEGADFVDVGGMSTAPYLSTMVSEKTEMSRIINAIKIIQQVCPLFVPLIEENWANTNTAKEVASIYLKSFTNHPLDALVLGCTHYPMMENIIQSVVGNSVKLVSSGPAVSETVMKFLIENNLQNDSKNPPTEAFFVTDFPQKFDELGSQFLGRTLTNVHHIKL